MNTYRIREFDGRFNIEIVDKKGNYVATDFRGWEYVCSTGMRPSPPLSKSFKSLKKAKKQVASWEKGVIYHESK